MKITENYISLETAKLAKEKGFKEKTKSCFYWDYEYFETMFSKKAMKMNHNSEESSFSAPTQSLLQKWIREIYKIEICIKSTITGYQYSIWKRDYNDDDEINWIGYFKVYEEALEQGLIESLKIIK